MIKKEQDNFVFFSKNFALTLMFFLKLPVEAVSPLHPCWRQLCLCPSGPGAVNVSREGQFAKPDRKLPQSDRK